MSKKKEYENGPHYISEFCNYGGRALGPRLELEVSMSQEELRLYEKYEIRSVTVDLGDTKTEASIKRRAAAFFKRAKEAGQEITLEAARALAESYEK